MVAIRIPLTVEDFANSDFDTGRPDIRYVHIHGRREEAIEGFTFTNELNQVGYTYLPRDDTLYIRFGGLGNKIRGEDVQLLKTHISSISDFERKLKIADRRIRKYKETQRA